MKKFALATVILLSATSQASLPDLGPIVLLKCQSTSQLLGTKRNWLGIRKVVSSQSQNLCLSGESRLTLSSTSGESSVLCGVQVGAMDFQYLQISRTRADGSAEVQIALRRRSGHDPHSAVIAKDEVVHQFDFDPREPAPYHVTIPMELKMGSKGHIQYSLKNIDLSCELEIPQS
jgi:hypothetical protein